MIRPPTIYPSLLAADFAHLAADVARLEEHVDGLHVDVMDGHFVPNLAIGLPVIESLRPHTSLAFDTHLMITNPESFFPPLAAAGCDLVSVHIEVLPDPTEAAAVARREGLGFGLVLNPATPFAAASPFLDLCDRLLVMSVVPGFGGQSFMSDVLKKIEEAREFIDSRALGADIQVDGGITPATARSARDAGAEIFVAGTAIFRAEDPVAAVRELRSAVEG